MRNWVNEWVQEGRLFVWRYAEPRHGWQGWHFTGDPEGCRSIRNLLDRMHGGEACHRTLNLAVVTDAILSVPNYGNKCRSQFSKLRIENRPEVDALQLEPEDQALTMTVGSKRLRTLASAFASVEIGDGDFGIGTSDNRRDPSWMFWWMPNHRYRN
jgi:hypothetical protein